MKPRCAECGITLMPGNRIVWIYLDTWDENGWDGLHPPLEPVCWHHVINPLPPS